MLQDRSDGDSGQAFADLTLCRSSSLQHNACRIARNGLGDEAVTGLATVPFARNDLLFTMSDNTQHADASFRKHGRLCEFVFLFGRLSSALDGIAAGGARRDRTDDLLLAKQALSQLSYGPAPVTAETTAELGHPAKAGKWWAWEDLNFRPHAYQARALTN